MKAFGFILLIFDFYFSLTMTNYFGNNMLPQSKEELLCDIMGLLVGLISLVLIVKKKSNNG